MPRLTATKAAARVPVVARKPVRARKPAMTNDRLTARQLFMRRMKRSLKPGLWVFGGLAALAVLTQVWTRVGSALPFAAKSVTPATRQAAGSEVGGLQGGLAGIASYAGFRLSQVRIDGAETTSHAAIEAALGVQNGAPILALSLPVLQARVEQLGSVQSATVERAWPGTLVVTITERAAFAVWQTGAAGSARFVLIDKAGKVIAGQDAVAAKRRDPALLLLVGADAPGNAQTLVNELAAAPALKNRVAAAARVDGLRWNLTLKDQTLVKLPADNEQAAIAQLSALQGSMALLDRPVEVIDLRLPGRLVVRPYAPGAGAGGHL